MSINYAYKYVEIMDDTGLCIGVMTSSNPDCAGPTNFGTTYIEVPVDDPEYLMKYYINGSWYEDAEATIPWTSSLL
jgi:hypothetical protein